MVVSVLAGLQAVSTAAPALTATIEDSSVGTGTNQVAYAGTWTVCGGCIPTTPNGSFRYSSAANATATIRFTGTQIKFYGIRETHGGVATVSIDGGTPGVFDTYAATSSNPLVYESGVLANTTHTAVLRNLGQNNPPSDGFVVGFDRAEVYVDPVVPPPPAPGQTKTIEDSDIGVGAVVYVSAWLECRGCVPSTPNNSFRYSSAIGATATIRFTGTRIQVYGVKERHGGIATLTLDNGTPSRVDTYAPTSSNALIYDSGTISDGPHSVILHNIGEHSPASDGFVVAFDRAVLTLGAATTPPFIGNRSGEPWLSGANGDPVMSPQYVDSFCLSRGSLCDLAHVYVPRQSWSSITNLDLIRDNFGGWPGQMEISVPPFPENSGASLQQCATGAYDSHWRDFGNSLNRIGRQTSIVRLAWEANGNWYEWSGTDPVAYVNCWRKIADAIRSVTNPDPLISWPINAHYSQNPPSHNPLDLYPGDQWVDIISMDDYDFYPASRTLAEFNAQANAMGGVTWLYNFAKAHGKLFGIGEWGIVQGSGSNGGGDNPGYITWMRDWMVARAGENFYYEAYFNNCDQGNVGSNLYRPVTPGCVYLNPLSGARYRALWAPNP
ncbi:conserved exported hypothetical protein [Frankia canadensis]|uniref:GH26 domain-containing protein n=1 Tax=Frankia canadensis TaxID=1836972 RepID=A0A2I2KJ48_9ACTN|nr:conserved exported hypothetical protein [Frankia canadensis]SOU52970.1 conserved exported hypothetical protein [Frankia canadensis]